MQTIFWRPTGLKIELSKNMLRLSDLNPDIARAWAMSPEELFQIGLGFIKASGFSFTKALLKSWRG